MSSNWSTPTKQSTLTIRRTGNLRAERLYLGKYPNTFQNAPKQSKMGQNLPKQPKPSEPSKIFILFSCCHRRSGCRYACGCRYGCGCSPKPKSFSIFEYVASLRYLSCSFETKKSAAGRKDGDMDRRTDEQMDGGPASRGKDNRRGHRGLT